MTHVQIRNEGSFWWQILKGVVASCSTLDDGNVTKLEFDTTWRRDDYSEKDRAPLFFIELDHVPDAVLNSKDFQVNFKVFDENGTFIFVL